MTIQRMGEAVEADFSDFYDTITSAHAEAASCNIYFTVNSTHSGRVLIEQGEIKFIGYSNQRGIEAVKLIRHIKTLKYRVGHYRPILSDKNVPNTPYILEHLKPGSEVDQQQTTSRINQPSHTKIITSEEKQLLKEVLSDMFGPMADYLIEDCVSDSTTFKQAVANILSELSGDDIPFFKKAMKKQLEK